MHKIDEGSTIVLPALKAALARGNVDFIRYELNEVLQLLRIDEQPIHYQYMPELRSTFMSALHELSPDALRYAKRFRLQWTPSTGTAVFYDFDVSGLDKVASKIPCGKRTR